MPCFFVRLVHTLATSGMVLRLADIVKRLSLDVVGIRFLKSLFPFNRRIQLHKVEVVFATRFSILALSAMFLVISKSHVLTLSTFWSDDPTLTPYTPSHFVAIGVN